MVLVHAVEMVVDVDALVAAFLDVAALAVHAVVHSTAASKRDISIDLHKFLLDSIGSNGLRILAMEKLEAGMVDK